MADRDEPSDRQLFASLASGGKRAEAALQALYERYARKLFGLMRSKGYNPDECEEILQESFLKLYKGAKQVADVEAPRAYLYRIVINCGNDLLRRKQKSGGEVLTDDEAQLETGENDSNLGEDRFDGFFDCLASAYARFEREAPERGLVIRLAVIEGMSGAEVAAAIGRSYSAAREFLSQTRKKFQALLLDVCGDYVPSGWADG